MTRDMFRTSPPARALSLAAVLLSGAPTSGLAQAPAEASPTRPSSAPTYRGVVELDPATQRLAATWELALPTTTADQVVLLLNDGLEEVQVDGPAVRDVQRDRQRGLTRLAVHLRANATTQPFTLRVTTRGTLHLGDEGINSVRPDYIELGLDSFWFPVLDGFPDITGTVRLRLPEGLRVVASGRVTATQDTTTIQLTVPLPDLAFVAAPALVSTAAPISSPEAVRVRTHHTTAPTALVEAMRDVAVQCATYLNARYGRTQPLPPVELVLPAREGPGYARKHYIVVSVGAWQGPADSARVRAISQTGFLCHELAHYWSTGAVASGPDNWVNEGFAEFVSGRAVRTLVGNEAWAADLAQWRARATRAGAVWTPDATARPDANASYGSVPLLLAQLETRVGEAAMDRVLSRFMTERHRTSAAVLALLAEELPAAHVTWFTEALQQPRAGETP